MLTPDLCLSVCLAIIPGSEQLQVTFTGQRSDQGLACLGYRMSLKVKFKTLL